MKIKEIRVKNYRNFHFMNTLTLPLGDSPIHFITGPNLAGKTNLLEAISLFRYFTPWGGDKLKNLIRESDYNNPEKPIILEAVLSGKHKEWIQFLPSIETSEEDVEGTMFVRIGPYDGGRFSVSRALNIGDKSRFRELMKAISTNGIPLVNSLYMSIEREMDLLRAGSFNTQFMELIENLKLSDAIRETEFRAQVNTWIAAFSSKLESKLRMKDSKGLQMFLGKDKVNLAYSFFDSSDTLNLLKSLRFTMKKDGQEMPIMVDKSSYGLQQILLIIFFLKAIYNNKRLMSTPILIFLFDEPELSLHPSWQYMFIELFKEFANHEVIAATHSPQIVKELNGSCVIRLVTLNDRRTEARIICEEKQFINSEFAELFFTDRVFLCEGGDKYLFRALYKTEEAREANVLFLNCNGKDSIPELYKWSLDLGLTVTVVLDKDSLNNNDTVKKLIDELMRRDLIDRRQGTKLRKLMSDVEDLKARGMEMLLRNNYYSSHPELFKSREYKELFRVFASKVQEIPVSDIPTLIKELELTLLSKRNIIEHICSIPELSDISEQIKEKIMQIQNLLDGQNIFILRHGCIENYLTREAELLHASKIRRLLLLERQASKDAEWIPKYLLADRHGELKKIVQNSAKM